ncbi:acylneuraminate cytidylyltransferase family protein [Sphingopyxis alaskensis]|jgi:CMP-N,N'-diacetyllegionaminic acid synthase|uniref:Acylneuraminate cytidylyltransferase n=1 Tax=Sphingopyxis alaskensis (strain DSM 13593 / LMG 18877 / RB2256) TaxID=317655 RepID=Q1GSS8_SPHAL|nr:acylneuraminate cytidylyltransferase family protein [Sphingopyxis alaskensis]ABF53294.1 acylneuraminate cytidylyltransferase [Sphingopyxis alaskensis RB2256]MCM3418714.1 acylneuraminate cytidylyltransferase family protein [Sphingopyxis alaskensis]
MSVLAIIPARGGSKGVPGKNLRLLAGKPLISWSIEQALAAHGVTDVVVSTDAEDIAAVARSFGAQVPFLRPAELATDTAPTEPVMLHTLERMEAMKGRYEAILLLQPTSPLRLPGTIDGALHAFAAEGADSLLGVVESHAFFWQADPVRASYDYTNRPRRQDIAEADRHYRETGSIYLTRRDIFMEKCNRLAGRIALYRMQECEGWEIDTEIDFEIVEALMKQELST